MLYVDYLSSEIPISVHNPFETLIYFTGTMLSELCESIQAMNEDKMLENDVSTCMDKFVSMEQRLAFANNRLIFSEA